jgi:DNA polymerase III subunit delta'
MQSLDWKSIVGHERQREWFRNAIRHDRLASTFLMVGPEGIGKRTFCRMLAKTCFCTNSQPVEFAPCGRCEACAQVDASTHPDLIEIARRPDKTGLVLEQLVGEADNRMREGLCYELRMRPHSGRRKIAIIDDADSINEEGANSLLKTLEEPPPGSLIFLISTSAQRQLPTIRSRCQLTRFQPLSTPDLAELILRHGIVDSPSDAQSLAKSAEGSMAKVAHWTNEELIEFRKELFHQLVQRPLEFAKLAKAIQGNVDACGSDNQLKRERLKIILDFAMNFYRTGMLASIAAHDATDASVQRRHQQTLEQLGGFAGLPAESYGAAIHRCLQAREHLDRMVGQASLIEAWAADLAIISRA